MAFYIGKGLQVAGLVGVGVALVFGITAEGGSGTAMMRELGGAALGFAVFWAGRMVEQR